MPRAEILSKQAIHTLTQLHAELAGKIETNRKSGDKLRAQMVQVEAVMKMLDPEVNLRIIAPKRRVIGNPWFKRGTLYRSAIDVLRTSQGPLAAADMVRAMLAAKGATATRQQAAKLEAAVWAAMRKHEGRGIEAVGDGKPARWRLAGGE
jgi:hypothetical protein